MYKYWFLWTYLHSNLYNQIINFLQNNIIFLKAFPLVTNMYPSM